MKQFYYFILLIFISACAVQGPISGGPVDLTPPQLISVYPPNLSTEIDKYEVITLIFNEQIDPISAYEAIRITHHNFDIKVKGKKIVVSSKGGWDSASLLDIYIGKALRDYQGNALNKPLNLFYSLLDYIPSYKISGEIIDIDNILNSLKSLHSNNAYNPSEYEVGLYQKLDSGMTFIKKVETDINSKFLFSALEEGVYTLAAVNGPNGLVDIKTDFRSKEYSILRENITLNPNNRESFGSLFIAKPIYRYEIQGVNFINEYWVNYVMSPPQTINELMTDRGIFNQGYYNFIEGKSIAGDSVSIVLNLFNEFESYNTPSFDFIVPEITDIDPPKLSFSPTRVGADTLGNVLLSIAFNEPMQTKTDSVFYVLRDSTKNYLNFFNQKHVFNPKTLDYVSTRCFLDYKRKISIKDSIMYVDGETSLDLDRIIYLEDTIYFDKRNITDLSGNTFEDSIIIIPRDIKIFSNQINFSEFKKKQQPQKGAQNHFLRLSRDLRGITSRDRYDIYDKHPTRELPAGQTGGLYGRVNFKLDVGSVIVIAKNIDSDFFASQNLRNNEFFPDDIFSFEELPVGRYLLYCYENYEDSIDGYEPNSDIIYPYFGGKWDPFEPSSYFSEISGPIEVRGNWDVTDVVLKLRDPIINHSKLKRKNDE